MPGPAGRLDYHELRSSASGQNWREIQRDELNLSAGGAVRNCSGPHPASRFRGEAAR